MQKITMYTTKKPKNCWECPCFRFNDCDAPCGLDFNEEGFFLDEIDGGKCPLKTVAELKKQIRKDFSDSILIIDEPTFKKEQKNG